MALGPTIKPFEEYQRRRGTSARSPARSPYTEAIREDAARRAAAQAVERDVAPDAAARANRIARERQVPPEVVDDELQQFERSEEFRRIQDAVMRVPRLTPWFGNPRQAMASRDDVASLEELQRWIGGEDSLVRRQRAGEPAPAEPQFSVSGDWWRTGAVDSKYPAERQRARLLSSTSPEALVDELRFGPSMLRPTQGSRDAQRRREERAEGVARRRTTVAKTPSAFVAGSQRLFGNLIYLLEDGAILANEGYGAIERFLFGTESSGTQGVRLVSEIRDQQADRGDIVSPLGEYLFGDPLGAADARAEELYTGDLVSDAVLSGVESVPTTLGSLAVGFFNPAAGLTLAGSSTSSSALQQGRKEGLEGGQLAAFAGGQGAIEVATERVPFLKFLGDVKVGTPFFSRLVNNAKDEVVGEQAATVLQDLNEWAFIDSNKGKTFGDYLRERPEAAFSTLISTLVGVTTTNAAVGAVDTTIRKTFGIEAAEADAQRIEAIMDASEASKLRERDPDMFAQFIETRAEGTVVENVYVPVEAVDTYLQSAPENDEQARAFGSAFAEQIREARATGGDIVIPLADAATYLAGTEAWAALKDDARTHPGGMSGREAREAREQLNQDIEERGARILEQAEAELEASGPTQEVYRDMVAKLESAGFVGKAVESQAALYAAHAEVGGQRLGITAAEYHAENPVRIVRAGLPEASPEGATVFDQNDNEAGARVSQASIRSLAEALADGRPVSQQYRPGDVVMRSERPADVVLATDAELMLRYQDDGSTEAVAREDAALAPAPLQFWQSASPQALPSSLDIDGVSRPTVNSEGQPIAATEEGVRAFWSWFGDSKVVDAEGRPLVVYHGTDTQFEAFDLGKIGRNATALGYGFYFAEREDVAKAYESEGGGVMQVYLALDNPVDEGSGVSRAQAETLVRKAIELEIAEYGDEIEDYRNSFVSNVVDTYSTSEKEAVAQTADMLAENETMADAIAELANIMGGKDLALRAASEGLGVDAIHVPDFQEGDGQVWVVFRPEQIKSVDNTGTFDPNDPRILYQSAQVPDLTDPLAHGNRIFTHDAAEIAYTVKGRGDNRYVMIDGIEVAPELRSEGRARRAMEQFLASADANNITVFLTAEPMGARPRLTKSQLKEFYRSLGFVNNLGRAKDFRQQASMVRQPVEVLYQSSENPVFYSALAKTVAESKQAKAPAAQWRAILENAPGIKQEELAWSGIPELLDTAEQLGETITREQLVEVLEGGGIEVDEVVLEFRDPEEFDEDFEDVFYVSGEPNDEGEYEVIDARTDDVVYTDEDEGMAENVASDYNYSERWESSGAGETEPQFRDFSNSIDSDTYRELLITLPAGKGRNPSESASTHWDQPDVIAHLRFSEKESTENGVSTTTMFIEEIQSDWHQKGRTQGYKAEPDKERVERAEQRMSEARDALALAETAVAELRPEAETDAVRAVYSKSDAVAKILEEEVTERFYASQAKLRDALSEGSVTLDAALEAAIVARDYSLLINVIKAHQPSRVSAARDAMNYEIEKVREIGGNEAAQQVGNAPRPEGFDDALERLTAAREAAKVLRLAVAEHSAAINPRGIPEAPFKTTWPQLVLKRAIRWAADHGFDRVAWIEGNQQNGGQTEIEPGVVEFYNKILPNLAGKLLKKYDAKVRPLVVDQFAKHPEREVILAEIEELKTRAEKQYTTGGRSTLERMAERETDPERKADMEDIVSRWDDAADRLTAYNAGSTARLEAARTNRFETTRRVFTEAGYGDLYGVHSREDAQRAVDRLRRDQEAIDAGRTSAPLSGPTPGERADQIAGIPEEVWAQLDDTNAELLAAEQERDELVAARPAPAPTNLGFDITPKLRAAALEGFPLFQRDQNKGPRGQIALGKNETVITLFEAADLSTLLHETGHLWLEQLKKDALDPRANSEVKADWVKVKKWFADNGQPIRGGRIPREAHELWARGFERYLMEGKAPSTELQGAFAQFRGWLLRIYQNVRNLRSPINSEIRGVFDRMLATQDAIEEASARQNLTEEGLDAFMAESMTPAEFRDYSRSALQSRNEAYDALLKDTMEQIRRRETARYKDQKRKVKARVTEDVHAEPRFVALHLLRTGRWLNNPARDELKVKISREWLEENYGTEVEAQLPKGVPIVSDTGITGDEIAELTGFPSGDALVRAMLDLAERSARLKEEIGKTNVREALIEERTAEVLAERGASDPLTDGSIEAEAVAAVHNDMQGEKLATQIRHLARRTGAPRPTPYRLAREWAARKIAAGKVVDVASRAAIYRYSLAAAKAGRKAEAAILEGDAVEAYRQKQAQLLNHALIAEAKKAADQVDTIVARMKRLANRAAMKSVDQDYMDRVHDLLELYDFRTKSQKFLDRQAKFSAWAAEQREQGFEVHVPARMNIDAQHYSRVTVEELVGLNDAVASLIHLGKTKQKLLDAKEQRELGEFVDEVVGNLAEAPQRKVKAEANEDERALASAAAALLKVETIADDLDNGDPNGPMNRLLVQRATDAENRRTELREKVLFKIAQAYLGMSGKQRKRLEEKVTIPEFAHRGSELDPRNGLPTTMTRMELLSVALNTGNTSNMEKMARGEGWREGTIRNVLNRELTKEDWDFVQGIWDAIELLWPDIVKTERNLSGVVPEKVEAMPVQTPFGEYRGGYYPVVYDFARSQQAENNADKAANDLFGMSSGVNTPKGHTITRTEAVGPIRRSIEDVLFNHIEKVITRISYAEYARDVLRVVEHPRVRSAIDLKLGSEYRRQIKPWLQRQVNSAAIDRRGAKWWENFLRSARVNVTIVAMGFRVSTGIAQTMGLLASSGRIGPRYVAAGVRQVLTQRGEAAEFAFSRSPELLRRNEEMNRDVAEAFRRIRGKHGLRSQAQAMAFWHIGMIDRYMVALPTWLGAHQKGIAEGMTDEQASRYADKVVRNSQGSGREKDLSAIQSPNSEAMRFLTMFYTYFNVQFNSQWESVRAVKRRDYRKAAVLTFWFMVATPLADALLSGDVPDEDDEDETWIGWFARNVFFNLFSGIPGLRDAASTAEAKAAGEYSNFSAGPLQRMYQVSERAVQQVGKAASDEDEVSDKWLKHAIETPGYFLGLPTGQPAVTAQFLWDYSNGEVDPEGFTEWYYGLAKGRDPDED